MAPLLTSLVVLAHVASCQFSHPLAVSKGDLKDIEERRKNDGLDELGGAKLIADGFDGRRANLFQAGDEVLLLPEVMSNLQFEKRDFAPEGDTAAEAALREASTWGRVYVDGWPTSIQYLRGHFGLSPPTGTRDIVLAEPLDACEPLANAEGRIVIAQRGVCTFGTKANRTAEAGAAALLVVNDADGLIHMPGPDAHDVKLSVNMIGKWEGNQLMGSMRAAKTPLRASLVPINCNEHSETLQVDSLCEATNADERKLTHNQTEGGYFTMLSDGDDAPRYEYLMAEFGTSMPAASDGGAATPPTLIAVSPPELCSPLAEDLVDSARGAALLVVRGTCDFFTKAKHANAAGAAMVIIANTRGDPLSRMGVQPRWKSLNITAPVVMVSSAAGDALRAALEAAGGTGAAVARFTASPTVRAATWRTLGELEAGIGWPADTKARAELIAQWEPDTADWPERRAALARGLAVVNPGGAAHTEL